MRLNHDGVISHIDSLPGSQQIAVFNYVFLKANLRGKGKGNAAHKKRLQTAKDLGYDYALCTVVGNNAVELHILQSNGWTKLSQFTSSKTNHDVQLWGKNLAPPIFADLEARAYVEQEKMFETLEKIR